MRTEEEIKIKIKELETMEKYELDLYHHNFMKCIMIEKHYSAIYKYLNWVLGE